MYLNTAVNPLQPFLSGKASKPGRVHALNATLVFNCGAQTLPASSNAHTTLTELPQVMHNLCKSGQLASEICTSEKQEYKILPKKKMKTTDFFSITAAIEEVGCCWTLKAQNNVIQGITLYSTFVSVSQCLSQHFKVSFAT